MMRRLKVFVVLSVVCGLFSSVALAKPRSFKTTAFQGSSEMENATLKTSWETWLDVSPDVVRTKLVSWSSTKKLLDKDRLDEFEVKSKTGTSATIEIEFDAPLLLPDPEIKIKAKLSPGKTPNSWVLVWKRVSGDIEEFRKVWRIEADGKGVRVRCETVMTLPFDPPDFMKGKQGERLGEEVERFRAYVGAGQAKRKGP